MSVMSLSGVDLYYETHGEGPPIVFVHGAGGCHLSWWQQAPAFASRHRVVTFDQRGFGASKPHGVYHPDDAAALTGDLLNLLDALAIAGPVTLVGHSLGSFPALDLAQSHPDRVAKLVLLCGYGALTDDSLAESAEKRISLFNAPLPAQPPRISRSPDEAQAFAETESGAFLFASAFRERPELMFLFSAIRQMANGPKLQQLGAVFQTARRIDAAMVRAMPAKVLVIAGGQDPLFTPPELQTAASLFGDSQFVVLPDAGHAPYFERAAEFNTALERFLAN